MALVNVLTLSRSGVVHQVLANGLARQMKPLGGGAHAQAFQIVQAHHLGARFAFRLWLE
jgi:hypothetical protein